MGIPAHGNHSKYVWIGMARMEMASDLKTSERIFQVSALVPQIKSLKVAYYSFQKRKINFFKPLVQSQREFSFGLFVATTVKRNDINPHYPGKEI